MRRTVILLALVAISFSVSSQPYVRNAMRPTAYMGLTVGGGLTSLLYSSAADSRTFGAGIDLSVHYTQFFSAVGLGFSLHYTTANSYANYNGTEETEGLTHAYNPNAHYRLITRYNDWKERQNIAGLCIPIEIFYRASMGQGRYLICGLGAQFEFPVRGKYCPAGGDYTTSGVFPAVGVYEVGDAPEHGFSTYSETYNARIDGLKKGVGVLADIGMRLMLGNSGGLYIGLYGSYGLSNIIGDHKSAPLVTINSSEDSYIIYNGTFAGDDISAVNLLRVGVKVGVDVGAATDR